MESFLRFVKVILYLMLYLYLFIYIYVIFIYILFQIFFIVHKNTYAKLIRLPDKEVLYLINSFSLSQNLLQKKINKMFK